MWQSVFDKMVRRLISEGSLEVIFPDGVRHTYGPGGGLSASVHLHSPEVVKALCLRPELALGEGYMDGAITIAGDDIDSLVRMILRNGYANRTPLWARTVDAARFRLGRILQRNDPERSRSNVAHHYDISNDLYRLFLDRDMQYSCAYFTDPEMSLEAAQVAKKAHIAAKLRIEPGMRVLDIGCGWGGMAITLARDWGARVVGVTLSQNQLALARERVAEAGLEDRIDLRLLDYRLLDEPFDRIVSVGMLEHVGLPQFDTYFAKVADLLTPDGVALIHTIGRTGVPMAQSEWINRYIFPGGYVPSLSELAPSIERSGLWNCDLEVLRLHYALTLRHWLARFDENLDTVRKMYDDRFIRMWRYYLTVCYLAFEEQAQAVFQFQLSHKRDAVPLTRDYLYPTPQAQARQAAE
ncbi:SAM-dependent methyltransferase [Seohaeicola zhoushanensis]|uniref:Cyclopropane-fatty-acyl-phospholipid synthase n=1 Tax=Seohaeicola zhoushanensis TaxID=1569283 RepID=A0A8J3GVK5_9RHOB|nr:cyclopropane-fatty-acyl-phospholipid synthase family protein [Seohaeicola zhoushanensis]GHF40811.1 cyclopropane-fatty-acyl-phospholipid synthase [Seohaeicola zhoushanensis]